MFCKNLLCSKYRQTEEKTCLIDALWQYHPEDTSVNDKMGVSEERTLPPERCEAMEAAKLGFSATISIVQVILSRVLSLALRPALSTGIPRKHRACFVQQRQSRAVYKLFLFWWRCHRRCELLATFLGVCTPVSQAVQIKIGM